MSILRKASELISSKIEAAEYADQLMVNLNETLAILNSVHDGVIAMDDQGLIYRINQSATKKFGITENLIGADIAEVLPAQAIREIRRRKEYIDNEVTIRGEHGETNVLLTSKKDRARGERLRHGLDYEEHFEASNIASKLLHESDYKVDFSDIVGESKAIQDVISFSYKIADSDSTVLIRGRAARKGALCPGDPQPEQPPERSFCRHQLRRHTGDAAGKRAVRL